MAFDGWKSKAIFTPLGLVYIIAENDKTLEAVLDIMRQSGGHEIDTDQNVN